MYPQYLESPVETIFHDNPIKLSMTKWEIRSLMQDAFNQGAAASRLELNLIRQLSNRPITINVEKKPFRLFTAIKVLFS